MFKCRSRQRICKCCFQISSAFLVIVNPTVICKYMLCKYMIPILFLDRLTHSYCTVRGCLVHWNFHLSFKLTSLNLDTQLTVRKFNVLHYIVPLEIRVSTPVNGTYYYPKYALAQRFFYDSKISPYTRPTKSHPTVLLVIIS